MRNFFPSKKEDIEKRTFSDERIKSPPAAAKSVAGVSADAMKSPVKSPMRSTTKKRFMGKSIAQALVKDEASCFLHANPANPATAAPPVFLKFFCFL